MTRDRPEPAPAAAGTIEGMRRRIAELEAIADERNRVESRLRDSEERYRVLYEENPSMYFTVDATGKVLSVNPFGAVQLGYEVRELVGAPVLDVFHPEDRLDVREQFRACLTSPGKVFDWEFRKVRKDGAIIWVREMARAVPDPHGQTVVLIVCEDITQHKQMEEALRESRERYRRLYTSTPVMLHSIDENARLLDVSDHWLEALGFRREEVIGRKSTEFLTDASRRYAEERVLPGFLQAGAVWHVPYQFVKKSGEIVDIELSAIAEHAADGKFVRSLAVLIDVTERNRAETALRRAHAEMEQRVRERTAELQTSETALRRSQRELQALAGRLLTAQEDERARLAREMHDDLTQRLAALAMKAGRLVERVEARNGNLHEELSAMRDGLARLSADVQALSRQLHPSILEDLGLEDAVHAECRSFTERTGIQVSFRARQVPPTLEKIQALSLYRITQEALRNVEKHAGTEDVRVSLLAVGETLTLTIEDAGCGFDPSHTERRGGLGLASMEERARLIGAEFSIDARPQKGTLIEVRLPMPANPADP